MHADYVPNPLYDNNPFIEALPPMLSGKDLIRALAVIPPYSDSDRDRSTGERLQLLSSLYEFYQPLSMTIDLYCEIYTAIKVNFLLFSDKLYPVVIYLSSRIDGRNKVFNQVFLAAQLHTGIHGLADVNKDFFILAVAIVILGNQHKDIVNIDFHLTDKLHLENYIVIDNFLI